MKRVALISFVGGPTGGSEGGVGWEFISASAELAGKGLCEVVVFIDARNRNGIESDEGFGVDFATSKLSIVYVSVPRVISRLVKNRRTRFSYLCWIVPARLAISRAEKKSGRFDVIHQVTYASAYLPSVVGRRRGTRNIWGPVMVPPSQSLQSKGSLKLQIENLKFRVARFLSAVLSRRADLVISNNFDSQNFLEPRCKSILEPNVFLEIDALPTWLGPDSNYFVVVGQMIARKRPWMALDLLSSDKFRDFRCIFVGDGALFEDLRSRAESTDILRGRVDFLGRLSSAETWNVMSKAKFIFHPSIREGSSWVLGEASTIGLPAVFDHSSGALSTLKMSGGRYLEFDSDGSWVDEVFRWQSLMASDTNISRSARWDKKRLPSLLVEWWGI